MSDLALQLQNYRLTTAQIFYHLPDHPALLQEFIWQELDMAPQYPVLTKFLDFWQGHIQAKVHSVRIAQAKIITPAEFRAVDGHLVLH
jgi:uncharacterized protein Usg